MGDCLVWHGQLDGQGYGILRKKERVVRAHRMAWILDGRPLEDDIFLDHICHNRACVRLEHLRPATAKQNCANRVGPNPRNKLGVRNVYERRGGYQVTVNCGKERRSSFHHDLASAEAAAEKARHELFGEFAGHGRRKKVA